jgi:hypothetical protein
MSEKWWDMSDDELDDLFREASDKVEVPFESSSFDKLRQKVDIQRKPEPPKGYKKRWLVLLAGLFLMVGVGLVYRSVSEKQGLVIDSNGNNSTEILGNIDNKNTIQPSKSLSSIPLETIEKEEIKKESTLLKPENLPQKLAISKEQKEKIISTQSSVNTNPPLSVSTQTTGNSLEKSYVRIKAVAKPSVRTYKMAESNLNQSSVQTHTTAKETLITTERSSVRTQTTADSKLEQSSVQTQTTAELSEKINKTQSQGTSDASDKPVNNGNNIFYNTDNQSVVKNNSKREKLKNNEKSQLLNYSTDNQNLLNQLENKANTSLENKEEEIVNRTNFFDVNYLTNKNIKTLSTDMKATPSIDDFLRILGEMPFYIDSLIATPKPIKYSKFGVRLAVSPDINSTETVYSSPLGSSFGFLIEYRLSRKFILQTGVTYSIKKYNSSFDDYHNFAEKWRTVFPSKPTSVDGKCTIIDIPINLRMNVFQKNKQTWFLSTGVSTYIMPTEGASYNFAWGPPKGVDWNDNTKYNWSTLNFSLGFEKQFTKHIFFQIEPYLKSPLTGIGRGGINLKSSGLLFSTKYEF